MNMNLIPFFYWFTLCLPFFQWFDILQIYLFYLIEILSAKTKVLFTFRLHKRTAYRQSQQQAGYFRDLFHIRLAELIYSFAKVKINQLFSGCFCSQTFAPSDSRKGYSSIISISSLNCSLVNLKFLKKAAT